MIKSFLIRVFLFQFYIKLYFEIILKCIFLHFISLYQTVNLTTKEVNNFIFTRCAMSIYMTCYLRIFTNTHGWTPLGDTIF